MVKNPSIVGVCPLLVKMDALFHCDQLSYGSQQQGHNLQLRKEVMGVLSSGRRDRLAESELVAKRANLSAAPASRT